MGNKPCRSSLCSSLPCCSLQPCFCHLLCLTGRESWGQPGVSPETVLGLFFGGNCPRDPPGCSGRLQLFGVRVPELPAPAHAGSAAGARPGPAVAAAGLGAEQGGHSAGHARGLRSCCVSRVSWQPLPQAAADVAPRFVLSVRGAASGASAPQPGAGDPRFGSSWLRSAGGAC